MSPIGNWQHFVLVWVTARRREFSVAAFTLLILANLSSTANARGGLHMEDPWASDHIEGLPPEIRQNVSKQARICGPA